MKRATCLCLVLILLGLFWPAPVRADGGWRHWSALAEPAADKGLLSNQVNAVLLENHPDSPIPLLWIATAAGLQTYNGRAWQDVSQPAKGVVNRPAHALVLDAQGTLWVGSDSGLNWRTVQGEWQARSLDNQAVLFVAPDGQGGAYVGVENAVWVCSQAACNQVVRLNDIIPGSVMRALLYDRQVVWIGTSGGLIRFAPQQSARPFRVLGGLESSQINSLAIDTTGRLWVGSDAEIVCFDRSLELTQRFNPADSMLPPPDSLPNRADAATARPVNPVRGLAADRQGRMWAATDAGLLKWDLRWESWPSPPDRWQNISFRSVNAPKSALTNLWAMSDGLIWTASKDGLSVFDGSWETFLSSELVRSDEAMMVMRAQTMQSMSPSFVQVNDVVQDPTSGVIWAATSHGVMHYSPFADRCDRIWTTADGLPSDNVRVLLRDETNGAMWAGTFDGGVSYYDPRSDRWTQNWDMTDGLVSNDIRAMVRDANTGEVWVGSYGGVSYYHPEQKRWLPTGRLDPDRAVLSLALNTVNQELWAGTDDGVWHYDPKTGQWAHIQADGPAGQGYIWALAVDPSIGKLWVGGNQVYQYDLSNRTWSSIGGSDGAQTTGKVNVLFYKSSTNELWVGANDGLKCYDLRTGRWARLWTTVDGLGNAQVTALRPGLAENEWWIGSGDGISHFTPSGSRPWGRLVWAISENQNRLQDSLVRLYRAHQVEFQFEGGSFIAAPGDLRYGYYLHGLEDELHWTTSDKTVATYTDLKYGEYAFKLRVQDRDGRISDEQFYTLNVSFWPGPGFVDSLLRWSGVLGGLLIVLIALYVLRGYPAYAISWGAAAAQPLQQLVALVAPLRGPLDVPRVQIALKKRQAFTSDEQVQNALDALLRQRMLQRKGGSLAFAHPLAAWLHRLQNLRRVDTLAEAVRSRHPLYAGARLFFTQAGFELREMGPEDFMLIPPPDHPQAGYGAIYTYVIADHPPEGDDFEEVANTAFQEYGREAAHRLAFVISNRRPTPGARFRLYEIRQRWGLAIISLDSELFGQVKPNMPAVQILATQIDQATGRQNLYAISGPVSDDLGFFGRETVLQQLIDLVDAGQPVGILGLRKTGKTSLVQRLQGRLSARRVIASVDTQGTARQQGVTPLYVEIIRAFAMHIEQYRFGLTRTMPPLNLWPPPRVLLSLPQAAQYFVTDLALLHQHIGGDERLLLIIDEVDRLLPAGNDPGYEGFSTFFGQLRAANQGTRQLDFILIGVDPAFNRRDRWGERDNELYQALREIWMPPMPADAASEMIQSIGFQMGIQYTPDALDLIVRASGGQPFVTRQLCSHIVRPLIDRAPVTIQAEQVQLGIEEYIYLPESYLTELWRARLDEAQRAMLVRLALADAPLPRMALLPPDQRHEALSILGVLQERTLIAYQDGGYVLSWGVLRQWIRWIELGLED